MTKMKEFYNNYEELDLQELMNLCYYYYELGYNDNTLKVGFSPFNRKTIERDLE
jgi:hypothetical protein